MDASDKQKKARREAVRFKCWLWFLHLLAAAVLGLSLFPMLLFFWAAWKGLSVFSPWLKILLFSFLAGFGYFLFGLTLIFLCVLTKKLFRFRLEAGLWTIHSVQCLRWMGYNSLVLLANAAFLDVLRISPFQTLFYRLMGARVGKDVHVNTAGLADLSLLEIGDNVTIGGGVALICHASERGFIRLEATWIGSHVSIGLASVVMPGCRIGDGAVIAPCSFLPKGTEIPPKGLFGGNPLRDLREERRQARQD